MAAPAAQVDEDWQEFNEFKPVPGDLNRVDELSSNDSNFLSNTGDCSDLYNSLSVEIYSFKSMEDLVHSFDEKLTVCFKSYDITTENIVPAITPITEDNFLEDDRVWNALTDNYGNVMPVDWRTSHTRSLHLPTLNLLQHGRLDNMVLDMSDDEELRDQMDMHSIIVSCINDEPLFTAEQVIEEIEEMMQESPDPEDDVSPSRSDLYMLSQDLHTFSQDLQTLQRSSSNTSYEDRLRHLTVSELTEALEEVETAIRRYSEELISALALRDELEYEKEGKNSFISLLIDVQNRQKEHRELLRKKRFRTTTTTGTLGVNSQRVNTHIPGTYLTTVIPYEKKAGSPSVEDLQILTKILRAMRDDSEKVPSLLTDYILKVLCPT